MKSIFDYFDDSIEYPNKVAHETLPYGTIWWYISYTFLNGIINYTKPISCFVLDRYRTLEEDLSDRNITVCNKGSFGNWHKWEGTKKELIDAIVSGEKEMHHTNLSCFLDDIIILSEIETNIQDDKKRYMFFWFDIDVSDCCIGKFETTDSKEEVIQTVKNMLNEKKREEYIMEYHKLPITFIKGWASF